MATATQKIDPAATGWWGEFTFGEGERGCWHVGPLELWLTRLQTEWRFAWRAGDDAMAARLAVDYPLDLRDPAPGMTAQRFSFRTAPEQVRVVPALANRSVVVRGATPFFIPPGETASLFVSTPLWVQVYMPHSSAPLIDIPIYRPSDTWFGTSTREGELCYASSTLARASLADFPVRPHRAITPVLIKNQDRTPLGLERINLPVNLLPLFASAEGHLWTRGVILERHKDGVMGAIRFTNSGTPSGTRHVAAPRATPAGTIVMRAWNRLFG